MTTPTNPDARHVLVINAGSSSIKYQLLDVTSGVTQAKGLIERIGEGHGGHAAHTVNGVTHEIDHSAMNHREAFEILRAAFAEHGPDLAQVQLEGVGHRIVHGGTFFDGPALITGGVAEQIRGLIPLAPLHNPHNLTGIRVMQQLFPDLPHVAVFDTAFHTTIPAPAHTYAVPEYWRTEHAVRRYGAHGTSHAYVARRTAELVGRPLDELRIIVLHLGNGASACAVQGGRSVETSMGMTPAEGLVMGTRAGDMDPTLAAHLFRSAGLGVEAYDREVNHDSGLLGLCGTNDFREVTDRRAAGDADAVLAFDVTAHRLRKYVGAYTAVMEGVDIIAFTAGIGEHSPELRSAVLSRLGHLGVELDAAANKALRGEGPITTPASKVAAWVVPTNEELEIARQTLAVVDAQ